MTTAELGLLTTAAVGVAAAFAPAVSARANRAHERAMARSTRLYEQRRSTYQDLGVFLERARLRLERTASPDIPVPPTFPTDEEWIDLQARVVVSGSAGVHAKLAAYRDAEYGFYAWVGALELTEHKPTEEDWNRELRRENKANCKAAVALIDEVERAMRDELAER